MNAEVSFDDTSIRRRTMLKVGRRLIPFMAAMFCANFLDRVNIGFAALQMNRDLSLTPEAYGFAAGILFIAYTAFEIPSNLILDRVGARVWLARIMITWGIVATANAFVFDKYSLYIARLLLGTAEAGFFPGIMLYLIRWFPKEERASAIALFMIGSPISVIFGGPLSTAILSLDGLWGLAGWKWLFALEGMPSVFLGIAALWWLTERPEEATWLDPDERRWLVDKMRTEREAKKHIGPKNALGVFLHVPTLAFAASKFCVLLAFFGITLWLPQIVKALGHLSNFTTGLVTAIPYICSTIGSIVIGRHSDKTGERAKHIAIPAFCGALGFVIAAISIDPYIAMVGLCIAATGIWVANTLFWTVPASFLAGTSAAAGLALINCIGNLGGFFGPYLTGWIRTVTGSYAWALFMLGGFLAASGVIILLVSRPPTVMTSPAKTAA